ncbi:hypothetical protein Acr_00g0009790 [Actinidia rufa]|uniref:FAR1 domain-containing protein n=1 Tax=Actinidia rufa TaxID=165716 RepID=A0A7J0D907_9ERIC|nr:hypothetical protein Acr_00g0009790 [Actinidia rufa]
MSQLLSPLSLTSPESVPSTMCPMSSQVEWDEKVESWSVGIVEEEEEVLNDSIMKDCVDGKEVNGDFEEKVKEPKMGMEFDTHDEAYLYYTRFAKEKGFAVAKRSSKKGKDGMLKHVILQCSRGGKPRPRGSNPAKARPQCKVECPAHLNVIRTKEGKWRVSYVLLEHNHEQSPSKSRFFKNNRALDENVRRKLVLNEQAGIRLNKTVASLHIEAGGPDKVPYLPRDCRNYLDKLRHLQLAEGDAEAMHRYFMRMRGDNADFFYAMDLNEKGRLRNVFWADARSREAWKMACSLGGFQVGHVWTEYEVKELITVGEGEEEIADLVEDNQEQYDIVMARGREMKREVIEDLNVCSSNRVNDTGTPIHYFSLGDGLIPSNQSTNILDPERVTRKGRPPTKRKQGVVEKAIKKKRATKKTCLTAFPLFSLFSSPWMFKMLAGVFWFWFWFF